MEVELEGKLPGVKARARSCKNQIPVQLEDKGGGLIPGFQGNMLHQGHKYGLSHKRNMKKTRLIIILLGFAWPLHGVRKDYFVFEAQFGYGRVLSSSDLLSQWGDN